MENKKIKKINGNIKLTIPLTQQEEFSALNRIIKERPKNTERKKRKSKFENEEQRLQSIKDSKKKHYNKKKGNIVIPEAESDSDSENGGEGEGIFDDIKKVGKKVVNSVKKASKSVENYGKAVIYGRNDYPPKVRNIIAKIGNQIITGINIGRTPVPSILTGALSFVSGGEFGKNLSNAPYDSLFHLFIIMSLDNGSTVSLEKNEVINMDIGKTIPPNTETQNVSNIPENLTVNTLLDNTQRRMGGKFFSYSARDNNCQDFIKAVFESNGLGTQQNIEFIKQDSKQLFGNNTNLRKISNTITDLGSTFNTITTGAGLTENIIKHFSKDNKEMQNLSKSFKKHLKTEKSTEGKINQKHIGKGIINKKLNFENNISHNNIMPRKKNIHTDVVGMGIRPRSGSYENDVSNRMSMVGGGAICDMDGNGLYAGSGPSGNGGGVIHHHHHYSEIDGNGVIHHHHHHIMEGGRLSPIASAFNKAFNPQKNGVAKAVQNNIVNPVVNDANKVANGFNQTFNPALGRQIENGAKVVGHYTIPALTSALGGAAGSTIGLLGGPMGGFAGGVAGSALGAYGGQQIDRALGIQNNTSFDGRGIKRPRMVKGSKEAKEYMASIRSKKN